eukprot:CAMPEP_0167784874 /NCGR_PEP_ID=MMETSP0111_2-20121227/7923_1 /TAXON_ID=91324 /ORGANISM="Lotharella globosa, Strain CCCM811" /LENGTH=47 /DNA_ID= /DNA_START= /DNA_END= /DNA_ORIENTATION=
MASKNNERIPVLSRLHGNPSTDDWLCTNSDNTNAGNNNSNNDIEDEI